MSNNYIGVAPANPFSNQIISVPTDTDPNNVATMFNTQYEYVADEASYLNGMVLNEYWGFPTIPINAIGLTPAKPHTLDGYINLGSDPGDWVTYPSWTIDGVGSTNPAQIVLYGGGSSTFPFPYAAMNVLDAVDGNYTILSQSVQQTWSNNTQQVVIMDWLAYTVASSDTEIFMGLHGLPLDSNYITRANYKASSSTWQGVFFHYSSVNGNWLVGANNTQSIGAPAPNTGVAVPTSLPAMQRFRIILDNTVPNVKFYINGTLVYTLTTNLPIQDTSGVTTGLKMSFQIYRNGSTVSPSYGMYIGPVKLSMNFL